MDKSLKQGLLVFGGGLLLFWLIKPLVFPLSTLDTAPVDALTQQNAQLAVDAYKRGVDAGENEDALKELNEYIHSQTQLRVQRRTDGSYVAVTDKGQLITV